MRHRVKGKYQLDVGGVMLYPAAMFAARGNANLPPKAPRNDECINGGLEGDSRQKSQNVISSLEEIIIGSEWEKLDTIANTLKLVHFLDQKGLEIYEFNFLPDGDEMYIYYILQIRIHENDKGYKYPRPLTPTQKSKIKRLVLQWMAQNGVKESDIEIFEERE